MALTASTAIECWNNILAWSYQQFNCCIMNPEFWSSFSDGFISPCNIVADGENVDCLVIDRQTYMDLTLSLEMSALARRKEDEDEEAANSL